MSYLAQLLARTGLEAAPPPAPAPGLHTEETVSAPATTGAEAPPVPAPVQGRGEPHAQPQIVVVDRIVAPALPDPASPVPSLQRPRDPEPAPGPSARPDPAEVVIETQVVERLVPTPATGAPREPRAPRELAPAFDAVERDAAAPPPADEPRPDSPMPRLPRTLLEVRRWVAATPEAQPAVSPAAAPAQAQDLPAPAGMVVPSRAAPPEVPMPHPAPGLGEHLEVGIGVVQVTLEMPPASGPLPAAPATPVAAPLPPPPSWSRLARRYVRT